MHDYFKEHEYFVDQVSFYDEDSHYHGNGIMTWNPTNGFHIAARVKRSTTSSFTKEIKSVSVVQPKLLRMKLGRGLWVIAPNVFIDDVSLMFDGQLSVDTDRVIFIQVQ